MDAVNLIPDARRRTQVRGAVSPQTIALIAGLTAALIAIVLYITTANTVSARRGELTRTTATATAWQARATAAAKYVTQLQQENAKLAAVRNLANARFPWTTLLSQVSDKLPARASLSSLSLSLNSASGTSSSTNGTSSSANPVLSLSGCTVSQAMVAQTMQQMGRLDGVTGVQLTSSTESSTSSGSSSTVSGSSSTGGTGSASTGAACEVQFALSLTLTRLTDGPTSSASTAGVTQ